MSGYVTVLIDGNPVDIMPMWLQDGDQVVFTMLGESGDLLPALVEAERRLTSLLADRAKLETKVERLQEALADVLEWPLPAGTVETYSLPPWLVLRARVLLPGVDE